MTSEYWPSGSFEAATGKPVLRRPLTTDRGGNLGDLIMRIDYDNDQLLIEHADPRIGFAGEILDELAGAWHPKFGWTGRGGCRVTFTPHPKIDRSGQCVRVDVEPGTIVRIEAANRTVVYRIVDHLVPPDVYVCEWPD